MIGYILKIKPKTTRYFAIAYAIYAVFGIIFFSVYPCASLNPHLLPPTLDDIFGIFQLIDRISVCPVRRKVSFLYLSVGFYAFSLAALFVYFIDRNFYLGYASKIMKKARSTVTKRKIDIIVSSLVCVYVFYLTMDIMFADTNSLHEINWTDRKVYGDSPASLFFDFIYIISVGPMTTLSLMTGTDLIFISYSLLEDTENDN